MTEHPILFNEPMSAAVRAGRKSQTRRVVTPQPSAECSIRYMLGNESWLAPEDRKPLRHHWEAWGGPLFENRPEGHLCGSHTVKSPYGAPGDRLWVRETHIAYGRWETRFSAKKGRDEWHFVDMTHDTGLEYRFDGDLPNAARGGATPAWWRRPSIFMPRRAARTLLEITGVRVERLQEITWQDAIAEGVHDPRRAARRIDPVEGTVAQFRHLWDSLNAERGHGWDVNPWVWVVDFRRIEG
ncbi:hypothetical protein WJ30_07030 [Burkholderia diffusa]|nr:hypothetical protein WJ30_07030 [Burkholderia diffusa]